MNPTPNPESVARSLGVHPDDLRELVAAADLWFSENGTDAQRDSAERAAQALGLHFAHSAKPACGEGLR